MECGISAIFISIKVHVRAFQQGRIYSSFFGLSLPLIVLAYMILQTAILFTETAVTRNDKSKSRQVPRCKMDRLSEGYNRAIDKIWGPMAINRVLSQNLSFWDQKYIHFLMDTMLQPRLGKVLQLQILSVFWRKKRIFGQEYTFRQNVKTAVSA